jgi:hypothetical protein
MSSKPSRTLKRSPKKAWTPLELAEMKTGKRMAQILRPKGFSSRRRIKPERGAAFYHVMSRTVNGDFLFGPTEKEAFRRMMWRMAKFAGVEILTYVVMDNHFHILLKVPDQKKWLKRFESRKGEPADAGEKRLLEHLAIVYSKLFLKQLRNELADYRQRGREDAAQELLDRFKKRFCDVSLFVKELKERFSRWFNKQNGRKGTLWMDRFQSVCVDGAAALTTMAAYIDLNPVRAGLTEDPLLYEWSGYGEAGGGSRRARRGLCKALGLPQDSWETRALARYRLLLYDRGLEVTSDSASRGKVGRRGVTKEARKKVIAARGETSATLLLQKRISTFSNGVAIGGETFVKQVARQYCGAMRRKKEKRPKNLETTSGNFFTMRE